MRLYICDLCGGESDSPHGCACGGQGIPTGPLPDEQLPEGDTAPPGFREGPEMAFQTLTGHLDHPGRAVPVTAGFVRIDD